MLLETTENWLTEEKAPCWSSMAEGTRAIRALHQSRKGQKDRGTAWPCSPPILPAPVGASHAGRKPAHDTRPESPGRQPTGLHFLLRLRRQTEANQRRSDPDS